MQQAFLPFVWLGQEAASSRAMIRPIAGSLESTGGLRLEGAETKPDGALEGNTNGLRDPAAPLSFLIGD